MATALLPNPGLAIAELGNPGPRRGKKRARRSNPKTAKGGKSMATKTKRRRSRKRSSKPRYGTKAYFSYIGKKGARKRKAKGKYRKVRRRFYPSFTYKRGPKKGKHYRPIAVHKYSVRRKKARNKVRHPSVKWSGRKGTRRYKYTTIGRGQNRRGYFTNPRRRRSYRRNPKGGIAALPGQYVGGFTSSLQRIPKLFSGKKAARNVFYAAGGGVATYVLGGYVSKMLSPMLDNVPGLGSPLGKRIVGGMMPFTAAFIVTRFVKDRDVKDALMIGGAAGSLLELLVPGLVGRWVTRIPGVSQIAAEEAAATGTSGLAGPCAGLGAYVGAPSYQGVAGYVAAPGYQGAGDGMSGYVAAPGYQGAGDGMNGYVAAPGYQGAGDGMGAMPVLADDMLAGFSDDNQPVAASSFLEQSFLAN